MDKGRQQPVNGTTKIVSVTIPELDEPHRATNPYAWVISVNNGQVHVRFNRPNHFQIVSRIAKEMKKGIPVTLDRMVDFAKSALPGQKQAPLANGKSIIGFWYHISRKHERGTYVRVFATDDREVGHPDDLEKGGYIEGDNRRSFLTNLFPPSGTASSTAHFRLGVDPERIFFGTQDSGSVTEHSRNLTELDAIIENFRASYLGTSAAPIPFGGRGSDISALNAWLDNEDAAPYLFLCAPPGRGKTALLVHWMDQLTKRVDWSVIFFPVSIRFGMNRRTQLIRHLSAHLAQLHSEPPPPHDAGEDVHRSLVARLLSRELPDGRRLLVVLDGLDEGAGWELGAGMFPLQTPKSLRVVVAAREMANRSSAQWLSKLGLDLPGLVVEPDDPQQWIIAYQISQAVAQGTTFSTKIASAAAVNAEFLFPIGLIAVPFGPFPAASDEFTVGP